MPDLVALYPDQRSYCSHPIRDFADALKVFNNLRSLIPSESEWVVEVEG